jgi:serine/threonine protein kinase
VSNAGGKTLGNFVVEEEIGRGGMGVVLLARQKSLDRPVVLKKLRRDLAELPELTERFEREARAAAAVHHQNVVAVYDCFQFRSDYYIAQEYVDGIDLRGALSKTGPLPWRIAALICLEVVRGLEEIHGQGTVHRDIKPANILLGRRGEVKIADFGIALEVSGAALTQPGVMIGSPPYMPPEQMMGERLDARGDLFALGVVLYEMLAGATPYPEPSGDEGDTLLTCMRKEKYESLRRRARGTPRPLARLVRSCLRARPRQRIGSAAEARRLLERRLGLSAPVDCRKELSQWLWEHHAFEARQDETVVRAKLGPGRRRFGPLRQAFGAALATSALAASLLLVDVRPSDAPAHLRASQALSVQIDDEERVTLAKGELLEVSPGRHRIVILHPERGRLVRELELLPGQLVKLVALTGSDRAL